MATLSVLQTYHDNHRANCQELDSTFKRTVARPKCAPRHQHETPNERSAWVSEEGVYARKGRSRNLSSSRTRSVHAQTRQGRRRGQQSEGQPAQTSAVRSAAAVTSRNTALEHAVKNALTKSVREPWTFNILSSRYTVCFMSYLPSMMLRAGRHDTPAPRWLLHKRPWPPVGAQWDMSNPACDLLSSSPERPKTPISCAHLAGVEDQGNSMAYDARSDEDKRKAPPAHNLGE